MLSEFVIRAGDIFSNPKVTGGDNFAASLWSEMGSVDAVIKDQQDGTYHVTYTAVKAGTYKLFVALEAVGRYEHSIPGSPFSVTIAKVDCLASCNGNGECQDSGQCVCTAEYEGDDCSIEITKFLTDFLVYENIALGVVLYIYCCYVCIKDVGIFKKLGSR